jgi:hypothetical protein
MAQIGGWARIEAVELSHALELRRDDVPPTQS